MTEAAFETVVQEGKLYPPVPEEPGDTGVSETFLCDLALKHVAQSPDPTTDRIASAVCLPRSITEELLQHLYREKLIEVRLQMAAGATRYGMLDRGWDRLQRAYSICGYIGPAPVSLADYVQMIHLQAVPAEASTLEKIERAFSDLVLPESLLQTLGCVINSRRSLFLTGPPGTGKTAVSERVNAGLGGSIWIPCAIEIDGQIIRVFDSHNHRKATQVDLPEVFDRRWVLIERPLIIVGGELTLENADLVWSEVARFYEAPFQLKSNGGTLVIDDFGRQRVSPHDLLNRWILPLERRVDFLTLHNGKKIEVPFEQLVIFSTNLEEKDLVDEAFLRRMGYRARLEPPTNEAYRKIFNNLVIERKLEVEEGCLDHILDRYASENRPMKACEPRDILNRGADICRFERRPLKVTRELLDVAWRNYFGTSHGFEKKSFS